MKSGNFIVSLLSVLALAGCAATPPLTIALTELGTATKTDKGATGLRLMRVVDVTGMNSFDAVGGYSIDPDPPLFEMPPLLGSSNSPDTLSPRLAKGCSLIVVKTYGDVAGQQGVLTVREKLIALEDEESLDVKTRLNKKLLESIRDQYLAIKDSKNDETKTAEKLIELAADVDPSVKDKDSLLKAVTTASEKAEEVARTLEARKRELDRLLANPGVVVTNWTRHVKVDANANVADAASASFSKEKEVNGYLVMGGIRIASLAVGKDLLHANLHRPDDPVSLVKDTRLYVTQHTLSARYLGWAEAKSGSVAARVQVELDKLLAKWKAVPAAAKLKELLEQFPLQVGAGYASSFSAMNTGSLPGGEIKIYPFSFSDVQYEMAWGAEIKRLSGYSTIYSSRATLAGLMKELSKKEDANEACRDCAGSLQQASPAGNGPKTSCAAGQAGLFGVEL